MFLASDYLNQHNIISKFDESSINSFVILSEIERSIKNKIEVIGTPLKDWDIQINYGIKTGFNEAFIIDGKTKDELISKSPKNADIIRPILRGRDIKRYGYEFADLWLLYIPWHFPLHKDSTISGASEKAEEEFQKQYPDIYNYLFQYKKQLSNRNKAETGIRYEWYALQRWGANYMDDFSKQKIIWKRVGSVLSFAFEENSSVVLDSTCFATGEDLKYILAVLNSKLGYYMLQDSPRTGTGDLLISVQAIEPIKIPLPTPELVQLITNLVNSGNEISFQSSIDKIVYKIYELNEKEISYIETLNI